MGGLATIPFVFHVVCQTCVDFFSWGNFMLTILKLVSFGLVGGNLPWTSLVLEDSYNLQKISGRLGFSSIFPKFAVIGRSLVEVFFFGFISRDKFGWVKPSKVSARN